MDKLSLLTLASKISGLSCPRCSSTAFHKFGRKLGIQRYRCTCCKRTFNETVNTPFHGIHDKKKMQEYLLTMHNQQSIRAASKQTGISVPTSFSWRHRILSSLKEQASLSNSSPAGICEIQLPHSYKGTRRMQETKKPATHSLLICDARGITNLQLLVSNRKPFEAALLITNSLRDTTSIGVTKTNILSRAAAKIAHRKTKYKSQAQSLTDSAHNTVRLLTSWMARFNGVATKYLQQYWNWYRAEANFPDFERFRTECFGQRQLQHYRRIIQHSVLR